MASETEVAAMRRAVVLAARGLGATSPNPVVGCVILDRSGRIVAEGFHARAGGPHAEVVALEAAGASARGGTAVVTLEPCRHAGRTGPCTNALVEAGVARVVYAVDDPTGNASGGAEELRAAGLDVEGGVLTTEAEQGNATWLHAMRTGRPFVTWKYAATLDGRIAAADGTSRWISGAASRADVHRLRSLSDAIVVGTGTVLADDPRLTVRDAPLISRQPLRVVVGKRPIPEDAAVLDGGAESLVMHTHDPSEVLADLAARGVISVLLESGPTLAAAFWRAGCIDAVVAYLAPALLGSGRSVLDDIGVETIADVHRLDVADVTVLDGDVRVTARVARKEI